MIKLTFFFIGLDRSRLINLSRPRSIGYWVCWFWMQQLITDLSITDHLLSIQTSSQKNTPQSLNANSTSNTKYLLLVCRWADEASVAFNAHIVPVTIKPLQYVKCLHSTKSHRSQYHTTTRPLHSVHCLCPSPTTSLRPTGTDGHFVYCATYWLLPRAETRFQVLPVTLCGYND